MSVIKLSDNIFSVGAKDWSIRDMHGYKTQKGSSYNSYLVLDKKIALIDGVKSDFSNVHFEHIKEIIDPSKIDIIISNHSEPDHSGSLPLLQKVCPQAKIYSTFHGINILSSYYDTTGWNFHEVDNKTEVTLGKYKLQFIHTNQVHWPDSMVTYCPETEILFSNDAFGQHLADTYNFDYEISNDILMYESAKYYANILYPLASHIKLSLDEINKLPLKMIAPSHGVIWKNNIQKIINAYQDWVEYKNQDKAIVIYDSMWNSTEEMARLIQESFETNGIPTQLRSLKSNHISDVVTDILNSKYVAIGSPSLNYNIMPSVGALLTYMRGLNPKNKTGLAFGSFGWNKKAQQEIQIVLQQLEWKLPPSPLTAKYKPDSNTKELIQKTVKEIF